MPSAFDPETEEDPYAPRRNPLLLGHEAAEAELVAAAETGRIPHGILIGGPRGIGKSTLAFRLARFLLAGGASSAVPLFGDTAALQSLAVPGDGPASRRIAAGSHADLLVLERAWDPKRRRFKSEIAVEEVRAVSAFLHLTAAEGGWRIVIVDGAEEMSRSAANALLKVLEEPPQRALLVLTSHAPGSLLPTLRSRCRSMSLEPLDLATMNRLLNTYRPDLDVDQKAVILRLAHGSIGTALELAKSESLPLFQTLETLLEALPRLDRTALHRFGDHAARCDDATFQILSDQLTGTVAKQAAAAGRYSSGVGAAPSVRRWLVAWEQLNELLIRGDAVNLDRKQVIIEAVLLLAGTATATATAA